MERPDTGTISKKREEDKSTTSTIYKNDVKDWLDFVVLLLSTLDIIIGYYNHVHHQNLADVFS